MTIKNSIAYGNGWIFDEAGKKIDAGNGNGFKMGGSSVTGYHTLINSIAFDNKAKGIDSNSCPDIQVENCISFNNGSYNVAMYTGNGVDDTDYSAKGVISYRTANLDQKEQLQPKVKGTVQTKDAKIWNDTNYWWDEATKTSKNNSGAVASADWFVSFASPASVAELTDSTEVLGVNSDGTYGTLVGRTADGTIALGNFLKLTDAAPAGIGARNLDTEGSKSATITIEVLKQEKKAALDEGLTIHEIDDQVYTGKAIKPAIRVSSGLEYLTTKDYSIKYVNNINAGTAQVVVTGKGNYTGTITAEFTILPKDISDDDVTLKNEQLAAVADGKNKVGNFVLLWGKKKIAKKNNYTVTYYSENDPNTGLDVVSSTENCRYDVVIAGTGNYQGEKAAEFALVDKDHVLTSAKISCKAKVQATGMEVEAENLVVKVKGNTLIEGDDFEVVYTDNIDPGKATGTIRGINDYAGEKNFTFRIVGEPIRRAQVTGMETNIQYPGEAVVQEGLTLTLNGETLVNGTDYSVSYKNNNKVGTAQIIFTGMGMYEGVLKKTFRITAHDIADEYTGSIDGTDASSATASGHIIVSGLETNYLKGGAKLADLTIRYYDSESGKTFYLKEKKDYKVTYKNNNKVSTGTGSLKTEPNIIIRGIGAYKGTLTKFITVNPQELDASEIINGAESAVAMVAPDIIYSNKKNGWKTKLVVADMNGKKLSATGQKADYVATYYDDSTNEELTSVPEAGSMIRVEITPGPSGLYTGSNSAVYRVIDKQNDIKKAKVTQSKTNLITYTGEAITLEDVYMNDPDNFPITVTLNGQTLVFDQDYEVVPGTYRKNVKKGTAKVTIRGIGDNGYGGVKVISFKISPKALKDATTISEGTNDGTTEGKDVK